MGCNAYLFPFYAVYTVVILTANYHLSLRAAPVDGYVNAIRDHGSLRPGDRTKGKDGKGVASRCSDVLCYLQCRSGAWREAVTWKDGKCDTGHGEES